MYKNYNIFLNENSHFKYNNVGTSPSRKAPTRRLVRSNSERMEDLIGQEEAAFGKFVKIIKALRTQTNRVKVEDVKDSVERAVNTMITYRKMRDALQADWRVRIQVAGLEIL